MDPDHEKEIRKEREDLARKGARPETLKDLAKIEKYEIVLKGECKVSALPLVSFRFCNCRALIIQNGTSMGLSHIVPIGESEDPYTIYDYFVKETVRLMPLDYGDRLKAIIVAGQNPEPLERLCDDLGIELEDHYYDGKYERSTDRKRDIIAIPSLGEVMIYTKDGRITKRFSE